MGDIFHFMMHKEVHLQSGEKDSPMYFQMTEKRGIISEITKNNKKTQMKIENINISAKMVDAVM